mmetsp:Transcript_25392/g.42547  ORF Transcript_25392/g.42547 Transcript_25392/m.42547 type:complete len:252 (-) Transcript_25392:291-1046(-)
MSTWMSAGASRANTGRRAAVDVAVERVTAQTHTTSRRILITVATLVLVRRRVARVPPPQQHQEEEEEEGAGLPSGEIVKKTQQIALPTSSRIIALRRAVLGRSKHEGGQLLLPLADGAVPTANRTRVRVQTRPRIQVSIGITTTSLNPMRKMTMTTTTTTIAATTNARTNSSSVLVQVTAVERIEVLPLPANILVEAPVVAKGINPPLPRPLQADMLPVLLLIQASRIIPNWVLVPVLLKRTSRWRIENWL